jgi:protoporphyrinogen oxidase
MGRIIIIGAGPAGLTAGYELLKRKGYQITLLEEEGQVGGISKTVVAGKNRMDLGGHRFFTKNFAVTDWWLNMLPLQGKPSCDDKKLGRHKELNPHGPDPDAQDAVMLKRTRISRIYYNNRFFDYPLSLKPRTFINMGFFTTLKAGVSYLKSRLFKRPEKNLEDFYINRFGKVLYNMFFEGYTEKLWGKNPRDIAADWGKQRIKGLSISAVIAHALAKALKIRREKETSLIEEFLYPKYGPGELWETVADKITAMGGDIKLNSKVVALTKNPQNKIGSVSYENNGARHTINLDEGDIVVSSMPLKDLIASFGNAPQDVKIIASGLPYRDFTTLGILVNKLKLKNETNIKTLGDVVPDCWIYIQDTKVKLGRMQLFNNWSPYMVANPENTVWLGLEYFCDENDALWNMSEEDFVTMAKEELVKLNIIDDSCPILEHRRIKVKKAYPAYFGTYKNINQIINYLNSIDNLYCVGRNGQHRYNNMDHSMITAFETVDNILSKKRDRSNIWNVNSDKQYHERT